jgi:hypothetical protein
MGERQSRSLDFARDDSFIVVDAFAGKSAPATRSESYEDWFWLQADAPNIFYSIVNVFF